MAFSRRRRVNLFSAVEDSFKNKFQKRYFGEDFSLVFYRTISIEFYLRRLRWHLRMDHPVRAHLQFVEDDTAAYHSSIDDNRPL